MQSAFPSAFHSRGQSYNDEPPEEPLAETATKAGSVLGGGSAADIAITDWLTLRSSGDFAACGGLPSASISDIELEQGTPNSRHNPNTRTMARGARNSDYAEEGLLVTSPIPLDAI